MDIKYALESDRSKKQITIITTFIENHPEKLEELMECFFSDDYKLCQRAAWPVGDIGVMHPEWLVPYLDKMIGHLQNPVHDAVVRNTIRTWQNMEIPVVNAGEIYEICFNYLNSPTYPIAFRVFSMTVLANISSHFPELIPELRMTIEEWAPHGSAGFKSRAKKELKRLLALEKQLNDR